MKPFQFFYKLSILLTGLVFFLVSAANATTYYSYGNKDATQTSSWHGNTSNGLGNPSNFNNSSDLFVVQNGSSYTVSGSATWTVAGSVKIENGGTLTVSTSKSFLTGDLTVDVGGTLAQNQNYAPTTFLQVTGNLSLLGTYSYGTYTPGLFMWDPAAGTHTIQAASSVVFSKLYFQDGYYTAMSNLTITLDFYTMRNGGGSFHTNNFNIVANWGCVVSGGTLYIDGGSLTVNGSVNMLIGSTAPTFNGTVIMSAGTLNSTTINMGSTSNSTNGTFTQSGGTITTGGIVLNRASSFTQSGGVNNISGSLTLQDPGTVYSQNNTSGTTTLNITDMTNNGTYSTSSGTAALNIASSLNNNKTFTTTSTSTVTFNGSGNSLITGSANTTFYNLIINKSTSGLTVTNSSTDKTFNVTKDLTVTSGNLVLAATDNDYTFANNVTVSTYGTLTHSVAWDNAPNRKLGIGGNLNVTGIFNPTVRSHVQLYGSGAHTIQTGSNPASTLSILTLANGDFTASGTLKASQEAWVMFGTPGSFTTNGNDVTFGGLLCNKGTINMNLGGTLTVNGATQIDFGSGGAMNISAGTVNFNGDFTINTSLGVVTCTNSPQINITGNWTNSGTFTPATSTVTFKGTGNQAIGGTSSTTFNNLTINNPTSVNIAKDPTVNSTLTLTNGQLILGTNNLILASGAFPVAGAPFSASNMIAADGGGEVRKNYSATGSYFFPVGDVTGTAEYSPISLNYTSGTFAGGAYTGVKVTNAKHPNNASTADYLKRYWTVSNSGITSPSFTATANYVAADIAGTESKIAGAKYNGSLPWLKYGVLSSNTLTTTAVTNPPGTVIVFSGISNQLPLVSIPAAGFCAGGSTVLSPGITNGTNSMSYSWSPATGLSSTTIANPTANPAGNTTYTLNITDGNGFTNSANTTVTVNALPATPTATVTQPTCIVSTGTITITVPTGMNYSIDGATYTNTTGSFTGVNPGTYSVTAKNGNGCISAARSVTVNAQPATPPGPTITAGSATSFCAGGSVTLASSAGTTYLWSNGATTASITVSASGSYSVQVTNASGCQSAASTVTTVTVNPLPAMPTATVTLQPTCTVFTGTITITAPTGMNYSIDGSTYTNTTGSFTGVNPGTYNVTAKNSNGCISAARSVTVNAQPATPSAPTISAGSATTFCAGGNVTLTSSAGSTYLWSNGATTASTTVNASGSYSVKVTNASACQSVSSANTIVTVNPLPVTPTASVTSQLTCTVSTGTITITAPTGMNYSIDGTTYTNTTGSFTGVNPRTYNVTAKNGSGCISSATSVTVIALIQPSATISYSGSPFCAAAGNILPVISGTSGGVFTSTTGLSINGASGTISVASSTPGDYTITYTIASTGACTVFTTTTSLTILAPGSWTGTISSDWNDPSNWVCGTIPTSAIDVTIPAGLSYYPVITSGTGYARDITIQSGASLTISGGALQISGTISNFGNLDASNGTLEMKGAAAQTIAGSMFMNKTIKNLIVSNTAVTGLSIASTPNDTLKITGTLSFGNISSILNTGGNLTLVSDSLGTASVGKVAAGNSINGQATVERYINTGTVGGRHGKSWQFLSAPVNGQSIKQSWMENGVKTTNYGTMVSSPAGTAAGFDTASVAASLKYYDDSTNSWVGISNTGSLVNNSLGYMVFVRGDRTVTKFTQAATPTTLRAKGTLSVGTLAAINIKPDLFQSIGNPYASPVDFTLLAKSPAVDTLFYAWDPYLYGAYGVGGYQVLSNVNGWKPVPGGTSAYPSGIGDSIIQSGQAFFVHATSSGHAMRTYGAAPTAAITFTEDAKVSGGGTVNFARKAEKVSSIQLQALSVSLYTGPNKTDLMADGNSIVFGQNYSTSFDRNDAIKIANSGENFGVKNNGKLLSIDARAPLTVNDTLYYNMSNLSRRTYQLRFAPENLQSTGFQAFLIDNFLKTETSVSLSDSSFVDVAITSNAASAAAGRFEVVFRQMNALLVTITSVTATAKNSENLIEWKVENESGIQQYEVEKSTDGTHFNQMTIVTAKNNGAGYYNATDADVSTGTNYYRIKTVSVDGKIGYTQIVKVTNAGATGSISVYPNPIIDGIINLWLNNQPSGIYKIKLYNSAGQVLLSKNITHTDGSSKETINSENLPKGIYQLEVNMPNDNKEVIKIIK